MALVDVSGASHCSGRCREYWTYRHGSSAIRRGRCYASHRRRDRDAGPAGLSLTELPYPQAAENDVIVRVYAAGFTRGELAWAGTWTDRGGRDRTPSVPGHEVSGVVAELGYGTTGLTVGQRVFGLADWTRNGTLAEYVAMEARNLAPLPVGVEHAVAAGAVISGLTAWQALFDHAHLLAGQTVLIHGAAGGVGSVAVQLARQAGSLVIGTGRAADRDRAIGLGVEEFVDLETDRLEDAGEADVVLDVIGGDILKRSTVLVRAGGTLVTTIEPPTIQPQNGRAIFFVVEPDRSQLVELAERLRDGRLTSNVGAVRPLAEAPAAFGPDAPLCPGRRSSKSPRAGRRPRSTTLLAPLRGVTRPSQCRCPSPSRRRPAHRQTHVWSRPRSLPARTTLLVSAREAGAPASAVTWMQHQRSGTAGTCPPGAAPWWSAAAGVQRERQSVDQALDVFVGGM